MGEKETLNEEEAALVKTKTKSNQSNDRMDAGATGNDVGEAGDEAALLKNKTKSNQSNDRIETGDGSDTEAGGADAAGEAGRTDVSERATWTTSNPGIGTARSSGPRLAQQGFRTAGGAGGSSALAGGDVDQDGGPKETAINNSHSNIKNLRESGDDGDGIEDARINNTKSNIKNLTGDEPQAAKLAPDKPVKSEIAIGEPGSHTNLARSDPGAADSRPKTS